MLGSAGGLTPRTWLPRVLSGERQKEQSWDEAIARRQELAVVGVEFVPLSIEAGGVWVTRTQICLWL